jgi:DmsE family decaheme c-type cytochrome
MGLPIRGAPILCLIGLLSCALAWGAAPGGERAGSEACATCHDETVASFARTPHAVAPGWDAEQGCENCHGPGAAHAESGDPARIVRLEALSPRESSDVCLECHKKGPGQSHYRQSLHSASDVSCVDCHNPHSTVPRMVRRTGIALCAECHQAIVGQFRMPRSHPLNEGDGGCANCHSPHGSRNHRMAPRFANQTCTECHSDKAGPFLYEHDVSMIDGCRACHQIHGTPNRHLLTHSRTINLCYQCHSALTTPAFHSAQSFLNEKCTACHAAIHGSYTHPAFLEE